MDVIDRRLCPTHSAEDLPQARERLWDFCQAAIS
jgi:hypothetical protein